MGALTSRTECDSFELRGRLDEETIESARELPVRSQEVSDVVGRRPAEGAGAAKKEVEVTTTKLQAWRAPRTGESIVTGERAPVTVNYALTRRDRERADTHRTFP